MRLTSRVRDAFERLGPVNGAWYLLARAVDAGSRSRARIARYYLTVQPLGGTSAAARQPRKSSFEIRWAKPDDPAFASVDRPREVLESRFRQGAECLVATRDGRFAGFLWFIVGPYEEDEVRATFVPSPAGRAAWDFDVLVEPQWRMSRLFALLWETACTELSRRGVVATCSRISAAVPGSLAAHRRLGAVVVGSATFVCIGRLQLAMATRRPWLHLSWRASSRPRFVIGY